jgi:glycosyltransferase involved in cell wall biosynthesis
MYYQGRRAAIVSYRMGTVDGVSVAASQWAKALCRLGMTTRTVAGAGNPDVLVEGLGVNGTREPSMAALEAALGDADLVIVDNICSLPMNRRAGEALARYLAGRRAILRHHDLPWERAEFASIREWPPDDPAWRHVTINDLARHELAARGIAATTIYHGFETPAECLVERRRTVRELLGIDAGQLLVLQPTRAIARKNVAAGLALAQRLDGVYWLTGPAEDGYQDELNALLAASDGRVRRRLPVGVSMDDAYGASDVVVLPSSWEGFGLPLVESALHRRPIAVGQFPVALELAEFGFEWFDVADPAPLREWLADPDTGLLDRNEAIARKHFGLGALTGRLGKLLGTWN